MSSLSENMAAHRSAIRNLTRKNIEVLEAARDAIERYCVTYRVLVPATNEPNPILKPEEFEGKPDPRGEDALTALKWLRREIDLNTDQLRRAEREMSLA